MRTAIFAALAINLCGTAVLSFSPPSTSHSKRVSYNMFFADAAAESESLNVQIAPLVGSESSIENTAKFMVDAFWLQSPQQLVAGDSSEISDSAKSSLINIQADDLMGKYGERMGKRKLDAVILAALEGGDFSGELSTTDNVQGMVTIEVRLLDMQKDILSAEVSERMLTQAVASLGPKQRREYKDALVIDIANNLLPADITAVVSLSNLCVSPSARRKGIAAKLCKEAERIAKEELGFEDIFLRVEAANEAAKRLYEEKLGYECFAEVDSATALRVDVNTGSFVEVESTIVVLKKKI
mmetsp:Transcript_8526/g.19082  ORF Transcript_8526/g.19082 Transcript_8526/m.19082 type:complete len:298 (-) Transcript_8526:954-1847(-)|eukprot:CAMPEP_0172318616 /NCGR_PEP_ID=MMETSP1058-20130122/35382_1 /TAXON_ID=83371 /ORGANISM="Detonula confervacea, Strain CCMP 353" /LENGTH=297 /DNA_ID=CAMNT_0013033491 /DNA_START=56 /DNA_END=949 /DNA_ORIENTATION=-